MQKKKLKRLTKKLDIKKDCILIGRTRVGFKSFEHNNLICVDAGYIAKIIRKDGLGYIEFYEEN